MNVIRVLGSRPTGSYDRTQFIDAQRVFPRKFGVVEARKVAKISAPLEALYGPSTTSSHRFKYCCVKIMCCTEK
jgi:hypothetical protein